MGKKRLSKHSLASNAKCHRQTMTDCRIKNLFTPTIHRILHTDTANGALPYIYFKQTHDMTIISNECFRCVCVWMTNFNEEKCKKYFPTSTYFGWDGERCGASLFLKHTQNLVEYNWNLAHNHNMLLTFEQ